MSHILAKTIQLSAPQSPMDPYGDRKQLCHIWLIKKAICSINIGCCQYQGQNFFAVPLFCVVIEAQANKLNQSKALAFIRLLPTVDECHSRSGLLKKYPIKLCV